MPWLFFFSALSIPIFYGVGLLARPESHFPPAPIFGDSVDFVKEHYLDDYIHWLTEPAWNPPTGGETSVEISARASLVIAEIQEKYITGNVLVVSHKATIRILLCGLLGIDLGRYRDRIDMLAGSISIVKFDVHGPLLQVLGERTYMGQDLRSRPGT
jgi:probable phosphoglycerate mutase